MAGVGEQGRDAVLHFHITVQAASSKMEAFKETHYFGDVHNNRYQGVPAFFFVESSDSATNLGTHGYYLVGCRSMLPLTGDWTVGEIVEVQTASEQWTPEPQLTKQRPQTRSV